MGDRSELSGCLLSLARIERWQGAFAEAERHYRENLALEREIEERMGGAAALRELGYLALAQGQYAEAGSSLRQSLMVLRTSDDGLSLSLTFAGFAVLAAQRGERVRAARLLGAMERLREAMGTPLPLQTRRDYADMSAIVWRVLDERVHAEAVAEGRAMSQEQAIAYGLEEINPE